jgi:hypothetical protein
MLVAFGLVVLVPSLYAQQNKAGSDSPQAAWSNIQQFVKDMETAVQSKNLHGIHEPSMKIRAPIKTLKQHSSMLSGDKGQKIGAALRLCPRPGSVASLARVSSPSAICLPALEERYTHDESAGH